MLSELRDLISQLVEVDGGRIIFHLDRHTLANVASQFASYFA